MSKLTEARLKAGLNVREYAALVGTSHATVLKIEARDKHRCGVAISIWLLEDNPQYFVETMLRRWTKEKPRDGQQVQVLSRVAKRFLPSTSYDAWKRKVRNQHPEFATFLGMEVWDE